MFALLLAAIVTVNLLETKSMSAAELQKELNKLETNSTYEFVGNGTAELNLDGLSMTNARTIDIVFDKVALKLSGEINVHTEASRIVFKNGSTLEATGDITQTGGSGYRSSLSIDGKLVMTIPDGRVVNLERVKSYTDKTAAIIVKGEGKLILDNPQNVTVVRPEDLKGLAIQVKAKKEAK